MCTIGIPALQRGARRVGRNAMAFLRRYVWTHMQCQDTSSGSKFWLRSDIGYYQFVELHAWFKAKAPAQLPHMREGQIVGLLQKHGVNLKWIGRLPTRRRSKPDAPT